MVGFLDRSAGRGTILGAPVLGDEGFLAAVLTSNPRVEVVVAIGDNTTRRRVVEQLVARSPSAVFSPVVHPSATIASDVEIGPGSFIAAGVILGTGVRVGRHCIVNTGASIDHDCRLGNFSSVSPGACLGGGVQVGTSAVVGLAAAMIHGIHLGDHSILGAGSVAVRDIPSRVVAYGVPARVIRARAEGGRYL